jgi:tyrosine-protein kinase Etk/Wzc
MRRGHLHKYFGLSRKASGLSETLAGSAGLAETLYHVPEIGLDFTPTGRRPPNPAELLASPRFKEFMDHVSGQYDLVIIDAPPALAVADPGIIGQHTGMSLLVVRHLASTKPEIQTAQKTLANSGVQLSGVLLNQFDQKRSRYGNYGTRYGYYYGGYKYRYD